MKKLDNYQIDLLEKATRGLCGGPIKNYPELESILRSYGLIYETEEDQPVNKFISEFREILQANIGGR